MALVLNEEQVMLKESAAGFLAEKATVAHLRQLRDSGSAQGFDSDVWREMAAMGWAGIAIAEEFGGLGYGYTGLGLVLEQAGRNLSASPLQSTVLVAATLITQLGDKEQKGRLLPAIASGEKRVTLALQEGPHHAPLQISARAKRDGDAWVIDGSKLMVLDASSADTFIVIARTSGSPGDERGLSALLVEAGSAGLAVSARSMVDSRSAGALLLEGVRVPATNLLGVEG
ncbi:MAG: acyl-CoA dehydrogenase family protein, partial [Halioglobus sp.]